MRSFTLLAVSLAAVSVHAQSAPPTTYAAWEALFPSCAKPCLDTLYSSLVGQACSGNAKNTASGLQCICSQQTDPNTATQIGKTAGNCVVADCPNADTNALLNDFAQLAPMCVNALSSGGSSSSAAPSGSPSGSASAGMPSASPSAGGPSAAPSGSGLPTFSASTPSQTGGGSSSSPTAKNAGSSVRVNNREGVALIGAVVAVGAFML